jgi:hypothetical protein
MAKKPTTKQKRDWEIANTAMHTALATGVKVLQDDFYFSDRQAGMWALKVAIMINKHIDIDTTEFEKALSELMDG